MNDFVIGLLNNATYISAILVIVLGGLIVIALPICLIVVVINLIYKQMRVSFYFISFVRYRKKFIEWHKQTQSHIYKPTSKD